mmetsp:Transcript_1983/g.3551  ORF Transcript_1983/g.3551 Transcript_1983/m.3551 type:complete len:89 (+) Transcript_1983:1276-1542(+)
MAVAPLGLSTSSEYGRVPCYDKIPVDGYSLYDLMIHYGMGAPVRHQRITPPISTRAGHGSSFRNTVVTIQISTVAFSMTGSGLTCHLC